MLTLIIEFLSWLFSPQSFCGVTERVRSVNCSRPFFRAGAYTESDNGLRLKKRSGNARLCKNGIKPHGNITETYYNYCTLKPRMYLHLNFLRVTLGIASFAVILNFRYYRPKIIFRGAYRVCEYLDKQRVQQTMCASNYHLF